MTNDLTWLVTFTTVAILVCYEVALAVAGRRAPGRLARTAHASLRQEWFDAYVRRAGVLYSWGLRHLILVAPVLASILHPATGPVASLVAVAVLFGFDRIGTVGPKT